MDKKKAHQINVEMFGVPADTFKGQRAFKTRLVSSNLFSVMYADTEFKFPRVKYLNLVSKEVLFNF